MRRVVWQGEVRGGASTSYARVVGDDLHPNLFSFERHGTDLLGEDSWIYVDEFSAHDIIGACIQALLAENATLQNTVDELRRGPMDGELAASGDLLEGRGAR